MTYSSPRRESYQYTTVLECFVEYISRTKKFSSMKCKFCLISNRWLDLFWRWISMLYILTIIKLFYLSWLLITYLAIPLLVKIKTYKHTRHENGNTKLASYHYCNEISINGLGIILQELSLFPSTCRLFIRFNFINAILWSLILKIITPAPKFFKYRLLSIKLFMKLNYVQKKNKRIRVSVLIKFHR